MLPNTYLQVSQERNRSTQKTVLQQATCTQLLVSKPCLCGPVVTGAWLAASYLKHLGVALLGTHVEGRPPPAVGGVHLRPEGHKILHDEVLIGGHSHLEGTLRTCRGKKIDVLKIIKLSQQGI